MDKDKLHEIIKKVIAGEGKKITDFKKFKDVVVQAPAELNVFGTKSRFDIEVHAKNIDSPSGDLDKLKSEDIENFKVYLVVDGQKYPFEFPHNAWKGGTFIDKVKEELKKQSISDLPSNTLQ